MSYSDGSSQHFQNDQYQQQQQQQQQHQQHQHHRYPPQSHNRPSYQGGYSSTHGYGQNNDIPARIPHTIDTSGQSSGTYISK